MKRVGVMLSLVAAVTLAIGNWEIPLVGVAGLLLVGGGAQAQPGCNYHVDPRGDWVECPTPSQQNHPRSVIKPYTLYVVIAFSRTANYASMAYHYDKLALAKSVAMSSCSRKGSDCTILVTSTKCVALAQSTPAGFYGYSSKDDMDTAVATAIQECRSAGGKGCAITRHHCSDDT